MAAARSRPPVLHPAAITHDEIVLHGHRVSFRRAGEGPVIVLIHGITGSSVTWERGHPAAGRRSTRSSRPTCSATATRPSRAATTRSAPTRAASATCWSRSATTGDGRRPLAGRRRRDAVRLPVPRARRAPGARLERRAGPPRSPVAARGDAARRRARAAAARAAAGARRRRVARPRSPGVSALRPGADLEEMARGFASLGDLEARQAFIHTVRAVIDVGGQRVSATRPALPRGRGPQPDRLGRPRSDHPGAPRAARARGDARQPPRDLRGRRPLPPPQRPAALRADLLATSSRRPSRRGRPRDHAPAPAQARRRARRLGVC